MPVPLRMLSNSFEKQKQHLVLIDERHGLIDIDKIVVENGNLPDVTNESGKSSAKIGQSVALR